jgi:putative membrane protein insertion efficiency factor
LTVQEVVQKGEETRPSRRKRWLKVAAIAAVYLALEMLLPPKFQPSAYAGVGLIRVYQATVSKVLRSAGAQCRFTPTCSHYGAGAIEKYGTVIGSVKTAGRILRCAPWGPPPGEDVP